VLWAEAGRREVVEEVGEVGGKLGRWDGGTVLDAGREPLT